MPDQKTEYQNEIEDDSKLIKKIDKKTAIAVLL